ncbi:pyridoxamine 5'-phosphate oxidase family protein [Treponema sp.]|uniref:pyridoxamine 5'-phosphate oxidase family protein n=1 Tax=Treponema sp. TaxID=166 RepID=UPI003F0DCDDB
MAGKDLEKLHNFLTEAKTYFIASSDGKKPRVRPFGTALLFEDKIYILTSSEKKVAKQFEKNPRFEISAMDSKQRWIRVSGKLKADNRIEVQEAMLNAYPNLKKQYTAGDKKTLTFAMKNLKAAIYSFTEEPEILDV